MAQYKAKLITRNGGGRSCIRVKGNKGPNNTTLIGIKSIEMALFQGDGEAAIKNDSLLAGNNRTSGPKSEVDANWNANA